MTASGTSETTHLALLEAEAVHIFREVVATAERPVLLFSGDIVPGDVNPGVMNSVVMVHLAAKAFWPARVPFAVMYVNAGPSEVVGPLDRAVARYGVSLMVVEDGIGAGSPLEEAGLRASSDQVQNHTLLSAVREHSFDALFVGARRDQEKSRAKERVFSFRDEHGQWDPRSQRPELWQLYNGRHGRGEHIRVFPLSNWTEIDIREYMAGEGIRVPETCESRIADADHHICEPGLHSPDNEGHL